MMLPVPIQIKTTLVFDNFFFLPYKIEIGRVTANF